MSKLLILGNTNVYTFCNSILGANEKSKEIYEDLIRREYIDENGNDNSGIANKVVTKVLSVEGRAVEEEEFKKKTKLDISKDSLKQNVKDGDTNTYTLNILNVGDNPARIVKIEETVDGNAKIKKDTVRILNSKGEDVTNSKNIIGIKKEDRKSSSRNR